MLSIKGDAVLHLGRVHVYSRNLLRDVFARAREIVKKDESRTIFPVEENGRQLFSLQYEKIMYVLMKRDRVQRHLRFGRMIF